MMGRDRLMTLLRWVGLYFHRPPEVSPGDGAVTEEALGMERMGWALEGLRELLERLGHMGRAGGQGKYPLA